MALFGSRVVAALGGGAIPSIMIPGSSEDNGKQGRSRTCCTSILVRPFHENAARRHGDTPRGTGGASTREDRGGSVLRTGLVHDLERFAGHPFP